MNVKSVEITRDSKIELYEIIKNEDEWLYVVWNMRRATETAILQRTNKNGITVLYYITL